MSEIFDDEHFTIKRNKTKLDSSSKVNLFNARHITVSTLI
jgi:hypothetical protein